MVYKTQNKKAFTLIELMVVIAIIGIVMAIILATFSEERDRRAVRSTAEIVLSKIKDTQNSALVGKRIDDKRSCLFKINVAANAVVQRVNAYDASDAAQSCAAIPPANRNILIAQTRYDTGATVTTPPGIIQFTVPHGTAVHSSFTSGSPVLTIPIARGSAQGVVCVYRSGRVEALMDTHACPR